MFGINKDIGIDLGTANTLVYMRGKGIIIREPSVVAVDKKAGQVRYVGQEAKDVIGRTPGSIVAVKEIIFFLYIVDYRRIKLVARYPYGTRRNDTSEGYYSHLARTAA